MWNTFRTDAPLGGIVAGVSMMKGYNDDDIHTYVARPDGSGPYPGVVMTHHAPGWDEFYREFARRFAEHGYIAVVPNLYERFGKGTPDDVAAAARGAGGVADASVMGDAEAALKLIKAHPTSNGKVGAIATCSGGRHALLVATKVPGFAAIADRWGANALCRRTAAAAGPDRRHHQSPPAAPAIRRRQRACYPARDSRRRR
jgi:carboxymethylenebutenolidase